MKVCWDVGHEHTHKYCEIFVYIDSCEHGDRVEFWHLFHMFNIWRSVVVEIMHRLDYWSAQLLPKWYHVLASYIPVWNTWRSYLF